MRSVLPATRVPTLVIARAGNASLRTIRDLIAGTPIRLQSRGSHKLKGVPGSWEVFAVMS